MNKAQRNSDEEGRFIRAFALAWLVGGVTVALAEFVVTGEDPLVSGVSWQSWVAAVAAAVLTFFGVFAWWRPQPPPAD